MFITCWIFWSDVVQYEFVWSFCHQLISIDASKILNLPDRLSAMHRIFWTFLIAHLQKFILSIIINVLMEMNTLQIIGTWLEYHAMWIPTYYYCGSLRYGSNKIFHDWACVWRRSFKPHWLSTSLFLHFTFSFVYSFDVSWCFVFVL